MSAASQLSSLPRYDTRRVSRELRRIPEIRKRSKRTVDVLESERELFTLGGGWI